MNLGHGRGIFRPLMVSISCSVELPPFLLCVTRIYWCVGWTAWVLVRFSQSRYPGEWPSLLPRVILNGGLSHALK